MAPGPNVCGDRGQVERKTSEVGGLFRVVPSSSLKRLKLRSGAKLTQTDQNQPGIYIIL